MAITRKVDVTSHSFETGEQSQMTQDLETNAKPLIVVLSWTLLLLNLVNLLRLQHTQVVVATLPDVSFS